MGPRFWGQRLGQWEGPCDSLPVPSPMGQDPNWPLHGFGVGYGEGDLVSLGLLILQCTEGSAGLLLLLLSTEYSMCTMTPLAN